MRRLASVVLGLVPLGLAGSPLGCTPPPQKAAARATLAPCVLEGARHPAECGTLQVPLDRSATAGETLGLRVVRIPSRGTGPQRAPLFLLAGGPGQAASEAFVSQLPALEGVLRDRDLVLVDQRGTGSSAPMDCEVPTDLPSLFREAALPDIAKKCAAKHPHNPSHFSTEQAAEDIEAVRIALGYPSINLLGISYGTRLAMHYAARHPATTRSLVLDSVAPSELRIPVSFAADAQRAFDKVREHCASQPACAAAYPALDVELDKLLSKLAEQPARVRVRHPSSAALRDVTVSGNVFAQGMRGLLYSSELAALLPLALRGATNGDFQSYVAQVALLAKGADDSSLGLTLSILCNEDVRDLSEVELRAASEGSFLGMAEGREMIEACKHWPSGAMPSLPSDWRSDVPVLALSGDADPVTPPRWADTALTHLPKGQHVVLPHAGHSVLTRGCVPRLVADFIARPSEALDAACAAEFVPPAFFVDTAGPSLQADKPPSAPKAAP